MDKIRPYDQKDKERVRQICVKNADCLYAPEETKQYILLMYCDYYIEQEPENCFVAVDANDNAIGYIICAENYEKYAETFKKIYLPQVDAISVKRFVEARLDLLSHSMFKGIYPAHFHIDIDADHQREGLGTLLVSALRMHLKRKDLNGMMLVCGADNQQAINFYKKNGFKTLLTTKVGRAMALDFEEENKDLSS